MKTLNATTNKIGFLKTSLRNAASYILILLSLCFIHASVFAQSSSSKSSRSSSSDDDVILVDENSSANVGIGTSNPTEKLTVDGDMRVTDVLKVGTGTIQIGATAPGIADDISTDGAAPLTIQGNGLNNDTHINPAGGSVGIGITTLNSKLGVSSNQFGTLAHFRNSHLSGGQIRAVSGLVTSPGPGSTGIAEAVVGNVIRNNVNATNVGVLGLATGSGPQIVNYGLRGQSTTTAGNGARIGYGVWARSDGDAQTNAGIYATTIGPGGLNNLAAHLDGKVRIEDGSEANGFVLVSDADGVATWTDPATIIGGTDMDWTLVPASNSMHNTNLNYRVGIGTNMPDAGLHVEHDDGALFTGTLFSGSIPATGPGTRMMWYPGKAAFRAGTVNGSEWDDPNVGIASFACGGFTIASGEAAVATGIGSVASGAWSIAMGQVCEAQGNGSVAIGLGSIAFSNDEMVVGTYNSDYVPTGLPTDRLFSVGNGTNIGSKSNAITILKNGNMGIGTETPNDVLEIAGAPNRSGLRFTNLNSSSPTITPNIDVDCNKVLSLDDNGEVLLLDLTTCLSSSKMNNSEIEQELAETRSQLEALQAEMANLKACLDEVSNCQSIAPGSTQTDLQQNQPNPFSSTTTIRYHLSERGQAMVNVFDSMGTLVTTLVNEIQTQGDHAIEWDASNLPSGVYIYTLSVEGKEMFKRAVHIK